MTEIDDVIKTRTPICVCLSSSLTDDNTTTNLASNKSTIVLRPTFAPPICSAVLNAVDG